MKLFRRISIRASHTVKCLAMLGVACLVASAQTIKPPADATPVLIDFESIGADVDGAPSGFTAAMTGGGDPQGWRIEAAEGPSDGTGGSKVLARRSKDASENRSPICVYDDLTARDVDIAVQFQAVSGTFEKSAGVIVRYQDNDNYYVLRGNAHEGNVRLYKVIDGKREQIEERSTAVTVGQWHKLRLVARGDAFEAFLDAHPLRRPCPASRAPMRRIGLSVRTPAFHRLRRWARALLCDPVARP